MRSPSPGEPNSRVADWCGAFRYPNRMKPLAAILLLDYTLYIWHRLTQRPLLWRFHRVHHIDREMDASTALRFQFRGLHFGGFRAAQMRLIGPTPSEYEAWQTFLMLCILFHHANILLPRTWERRLASVLVTPRLHGIDHSTNPEEMNSDWSSGSRSGIRFTACYGKSPE